MARKSAGKLKPKLTDAERHERFVEMAREVGASDSPRAFEKAFNAVVQARGPRIRGSLHALGKATKDRADK